MTTTTTITATATSTPIAHTWEAGPLKLIPTPIARTGATDQYTYVASEMALVHNCIIRALNTIYIQAPFITRQDETPFISYTLSIYQGLQAHHDGEETFLFPELERLTGEKGLMDVNISQHAAFHTGFEAWGAWLLHLKSGKGRWDGEKCVRMLDTFIEPLAQHLNDEIPTLLGLARYGDEIDVKGLLKEEGDRVMAGLSKTTQLPAFLLNHDQSFEGGIHQFPPLPTPVTWTLINVFGRWNANWWKFSSCGYDGCPRPRGLYIFS